MERKESLNSEPNYQNEIDDYLRRLFSETTSVEEYRECFYRLGQILGIWIKKSVPTDGQSIMVACSTEDADWLGRGVMDGLGADRISLAVFWNEIVKPTTEFNGEYSPIVKSYIEPVENCDTLIIVKSVIHSILEVKTQLLRLLGRMNPKSIFVASPQMYKAAPSHLKTEFSRDISDKFCFLTFEIFTDTYLEEDSHPDAGETVCQRLGLGDNHQKNRYMSNLVKERVNTQLDEDWNRKQ